MKITMYELLGMIKDGKAPKRIRIRGAGGAYDKEFYFDGNIYMYKDEYEEYAMTDDISIEMFLNDEVEILEEENKFTKEDFIKEAMDLEGLTREEFNKIYEVKECNCGREFCKGFIKVEKVKEEKKMPEKLEILPNNEQYSNKILYGKINEIIDYLKSKGDE